MKEKTTTESTERVARASRMIRAGYSREYWSNLKSTPRQILLPLTKAELISLLWPAYETVDSVESQENAEIRALMQKVRKPELLRNLVAICKRIRADALCDRRGAIEHTKKLRAARASGEA